METKTLKDGFYLSDHKFRVGDIVYVKDNFGPPEMRGVQGLVVKVDGMWIRVSLETKEKVVTTYPFLKNEISFQRSDRWRQSP